MRYLRSFLESVESNPSVEEVQSYFNNVIEDFCDMQSQDFTFKVYTTPNYKNEPFEKIKLVEFQIKSNSKFEVEDIYPVFKRLFEWSKFNGANLHKHFKINLKSGLKIVFQDRSHYKINYTQVNFKRLCDPSFDLIKFWEYTCVFTWE